MKITKFDTSTDLDEIKIMLERKAESWNKFLNTIEKNNEGTYIARCDNKVAGFLSLNRYDVRRVDISVYVDEKLRRKGIGTELVRFSDRIIAASQFEHAYCIFTADEGTEKFLIRNGYRLYCSAYDMARDNTLIDNYNLSDSALFEKGIVIRNYEDDDYIAYHNISDVAFFLLREKLGMTPSFYLPMLEIERIRLANDSVNRYVMIVNGVTTAIGAVNKEWIHILAVRPDLQLHGYGRIMASYLNNIIVLKRNPEKVKICVLEGNPAKRLYESLGFRDVSFSHDYIKYYKPDSRPKSPKGYANKEEILNELRINGKLNEEMEL